MPTVYYLGLFLSVLLAFTACQSQPTPAPTSVAQLPTATATATATFTAVPPTATPTITNTPDRVATALAQPTRTSRPTFTPTSTFTPYPTVPLPAPIWFSATSEPNFPATYQLGLQQALGGAISEVTAAGSYVYVVMGVNLIALDGQNPAELQEIARSFQPSVSALAAVGQVVYVANSQEITILELSAGELNLLTSFTAPFAVETLEIQNGQLWATACGQTTECQNQQYDLTNPAAPQPAGETITPNPSDLSSPYTLTVTFNGTRFESDGQRLSSYDANNTLLKQVPTEGMAYGRAIWVEPYLFVEGGFCEGSCGFWLNVFDLRQPKLLPKVFSVSNEVYDWFQTSDYLYFATEDGLLLVDTTPPLKIVGEWQAAGAFTQLEVTDSLVYGYDNGLLTQFNGTSDNQTVIGELTALQSEGDYLFAHDSLTLTHFDPQLTELMNLPLAHVYGEIGFAVAHEGLLYHSYKDTEATIWHVSTLNGSAITPIHEFNLGERVSFEMGVWHNNHILAYGSNTLYNLDVSNPAVPQLIAYYPTPGRASGLLITDTAVYLADGDAGILVFEKPSQE